MRRIVKKLENKLKGTTKKALKLEAQVKHSYIMTKELSLKPA